MNRDDLAAALFAAMGWPTRQNQFGRVHRAVAAIEQEAAAQALHAVRDEVAALGTTEIGHDRRLMLNRDTALAILDAALSRGTTEGGPEGEQIRAATPSESRSGAPEQAAPDLRASVHAALSWLPQDPDAAADELCIGLRAASSLPSREALAAALPQTLVVAVGTPRMRTYHFTDEERLAIADATLAALPPTGSPETLLLDALWRCGVASGMDTDGDDGPGAMVAGMGLAGFARAMVENVEQLRRDYNECLDESGS